MVVTIERRVSPASEWAMRFAYFAAVLFIVGSLSHRYRLLETVAFFWVLGIIGLLAVVALGLALTGFIDLWEHGDKGGRKALAAGLLACLILVPFGLSAWRVFEYPRLVDVSTDTADPPSFRSLALLRPPTANTIGPIDANAANLIEASYPEIAGRRYAASPDRVIEAVLAIMAEREWEVVATRGIPQQDSEITLEARAFSLIMRYPADVAVRLTDEEASTFVDMRSASHFAKHDLGDNAARIMRFMADLDSLMQQVGADRAGMVPAKDTANFVKRTARLERHGGGPPPSVSFPVSVPGRAMPARFQYQAPRGGPDGERTRPLSPLEGFPRSKGNV